jgi:mono/diheme cytochrome c family protein
VNAGDAAGLVMVALALGGFSAFLYLAYTRWSLSPGERLLVTTMALLLGTFAVLFVWAFFHPKITARYSVGAQASAGLQVFNRQGCASCHDLFGEGQTGSAGPPLDGEGSRRSKAWLAAYLRTPAGVVPGTLHDGSYATNFSELSAADRAALVALLAGATVSAGSGLASSPPP